jgi:S-adenosylmethionine hydrolase
VRRRRYWLEQESVSAFLQPMKLFPARLLALLSCLTAAGLAADDSPANALVLQTDFGTKDGAVAAMKGVAFGIAPRLRIFDLTHENTPYNVWEAAYRLKQAAPYWPAGTVFVSVVDPGVGTARASVVLRTKTGQYFVGPDNGTWTLVAEDLGIGAVRRIDETTNRRPGSEKSYTFHGRDVYVYTGARLASGMISFEQVGPLLEPRVVSLPYQHAAGDAAGVTGAIPLIDFHFGNVWTNIPDGLFAGMKPEYGQKFLVVIRHENREVYRGTMPYVRTFGDVPEGAPLLYLNSLLNVAFALNMGNFSQTYGLSAGGDWAATVTRAQ